MSEAVTVIRDYIDLAIYHTREALDIVENADADLESLPALLGRAMDELERVERYIEQMEKRKGDPNRRQVGCPA